MPLYDFACSACGHVTELLAPVDQLIAACAVCRGPAQRIISGRSAYRSDADWVASCVVGFDPEDTRPAVRAYFANPHDRHVLARAMRVAGIRHKDHGEDAAAKLARSAMQNMEPVTREVYERFQARHGR